LKSRLPRFAVCFKVKTARSNQVTGAVTKNTIGQPNPVIKENIQNNGTYVYGTVSVISTRGFTQITSSPACQ
jgi:hypothetical protein